MHSLWNIYFGNLRSLMEYRAKLQDPKTKEVLSFLRILDPVRYENQIIPYIEHKTKGGAEEETLGIASFQELWEVAMLYPFMPLYLFPWEVTDPQILLEVCQNHLTNIRQLKLGHITFKASYIAAWKPIIPLVKERVWCVQLELYNIYDALDHETLPAVKLHQFKPDRPMPSITHLCANRSIDVVDWDLYLPNLETLELEFLGNNCSLLGDLEYKCMTLLNATSLKTLIICHEEWNELTSVLKEHLENHIENIRVR